MKIALKYGLLITLCIIIWTLLAHWAVPNPESNIHQLGAAIFFNVVEIIGIYCGIKARKDSTDGQLTFKEGVKTGMSIAVVYAISSCLFFLINILRAGTGMVAGESGVQGRPMWQVVLGAFLGLFTFALLLGLIYSVVNSFILTARRKTETK
jgi:hypothetical protein